MMDQWIDEPLHGFTDEGYRKNSDMKLMEKSPWVSYQ